MDNLLADRSVHIVGLGLMGGSLAMALRDQVRSLTAEDLVPAILEKALAHGVIDAVGTTCEADMVILSVPADQIIRLIPSLNFKPEALVLDLGSTKTRICEQLDQLPPGVLAVGGHPMCGLAENGFGHAIPTLYQNARFVLCETSHTTGEAPALAEALVRAVGAKPLWMDPVQHDYLTALTSHLPHLLSFTLMQLAMETSNEDAALYDLAAGGFDGATRLARTDETMIVGMFSTNTDQLRGAVARFRAHLDRLDAMLDDVSVLREELSKIVAARRAYTTGYGERKICMSRAIRVRPGRGLRGTVRVPGDKLISHRTLILGALSDGVSQVRGFLPAGDTLATLGCVRALGVAVDQHDSTTLTVHGRGLHGLLDPDAPLNCVNAGTAIRLLAGVLAGQPFPSVLDGSEQLRRRPMRRITDPLRQMGARIADTEGRAPLHLRPTSLQGITYQMPVASAQVKSCLLLAGLFAEGTTTVIEPGPARDHTERMLRGMGQRVQVNGGCVMLTPGSTLRPLDVTVPGDISSAAFVLVAGLLNAVGEVRIEGVNVNPTRTGILDIFALMGSQVRVSDSWDEAGEPVADMVTHRMALTGADIRGDLIVRAIDEFPALMVAATQADGMTVVSDAAELRVKETDRIAVMAGELRKFGAQIEERSDGFAMRGPQKLRGVVVDGHDDHRVAMSLVVAGLCAEGETLVNDARCVEDSFPGFVETMQALGADVEWAEYD